MSETTDPTTDPGTRPATDRLRVGVLLYAGVEPLDAIGPAQVFWSLEPLRPWLAPYAEVEVLLVAEQAGPVECGYGLVVHADVDYDECPPLDVLIVPGGTGDEDAPGVGRRHLQRHEPTLAFVRRQAAETEIMASVCTGAFILAGAGLLAGRTANTHWSARDELAGFMAERGEALTLDASRVVDDGDIVTAGGVSSGIDLALHLVGRLLGPAVRDGAAMVIEQETPALAGAGAARSR